MTTNWARKEKLKSGGQAEIWLVEDIALGTQAVMKRLYPARSLLDADRAAELRRFEREVRTQRTLSEGHQGIMPIIGENFESEPPFYIMHQASETLGDLISRYPSGLPPSIAVAILEKICEAVTYAHLHHVYHRDLKPENILKLYNRWVVGDFGLCRDATADSTTFTQANAVFGTFAYMPPEQYDNPHDVGREADVFSLGRILYHMLTGKLPAPFQRLSRLPAEFREVVNISTAELPQDRYASVAGFSHALAMSGFSHAFSKSGTAKLVDIPGVEAVRLGDLRQTSSSSVPSGT